VISFARRSPPKPGQFSTPVCNTAGRALCSSVGMQLEGILRHERVDASGELRNTCVFASVQ
jgi:hypothetical protein